MEWKTLTADANNYIFLSIGIYGRFHITQTPYLHHCQHMHPFFILYCVFYQPSEELYATMGMPGADALGLHISHGTMEFTDGQYLGRLGDTYGPSEISNVIYEPGFRFEFDKRYLTPSNKETVHYKLTWDAKNQWWTGTWDIFHEEEEPGRSLDNGKARIHLTPSSLEFFRLTQ